MKTKTAAYSIGAALSAAILGIFAWGRVRSVDVPQPASWEHTPVVCAADGVDRPALRSAVDAWREHGHPVRLGCDEADITLTVDPSLDTDDGGLRTDDGDGTHVLDGVSQTWGVTRCQAVGMRLTACAIRMHPRGGALAYTHELGHALGYLHPPLCPSGHLLHPSRPGWDWRGL